MLHIDDEQRRARLAHRHRLLRTASGPDEAAGAMSGLHSSDPATVYLSAWARVDGFGVGALEASLYEERSLVRMLGMRRTLFVVPRPTAAWMNEACTKALVAGERRRLVTMFAEHGVARDPGRWLTRVSNLTLAALDELGEATASELTARVPHLATKLTVGEGTKWAGTVGVSTRVLFLLATEGRIVRARPRGRWTSGQYRWARTERWLGAPLPSLAHAEACAGLLGGWLAAFGPVTMTDVRWWTGWTARLARETLGALDAVEVGLDGGTTGYVLPGDEGPVEPPGPWVALLPGLDPTSMGWKERAWYVGEHAGRLFDRNGNAGPTVWADGRMVGGWACAEAGEVVLALTETVPKSVQRAIERERQALTGWLDGVRVRSRFPSPLERELVG